VVAVAAAPARIAAATVPRYIRRYLPGACAGRIDNQCLKRTMKQQACVLLRFVSDNVWGSADRQFVFRHIAEYLVQAWDVRNTCKHSGAVLPFPSAPVGRGVDGIDAMA
jgi:hypothetical protein